MNYYISAIFIYFIYFFFFFLEFGKTRELDEVEIMFVLNPRDKYRLFELLNYLRTDLESLVQLQG
jgi:hypothetical protein